MTREVLHAGAADQPATARAGPASGGVLRPEVGTAADERDALLPQGAPPVPPPVGPATPLPPTGRARRVAVLVAALLAAVGGWTWTGLARSAQALAGRGDTTAAVALVTGARPGERESQVVRGVFDVTVRNVGGVPFQVRGTAASLGAVAVEAVDGAGEVAPGASRQLLLHVWVSCASPLPLRLPALRLTGPDGGSGAVVRGGAAVLAGWCAGVDRDLLELAGTTGDGDRLRVVLRVPSGRTTRIDAVRAGGVLLSASPLPIWLGGQASTLWLTPPRPCPRAWSAGGLPTSVDLDADVGGPATVSVAVGPDLARWLAEHGCGRSR